MTIDELEQVDEPGAAGSSTVPDGMDGGTDDVTRLWPGDAGSLLAGSRRALVQLLRGPYLSAARHAQLWGALLRDEPAVRARLADLYLELIVDLDEQIAFVRNVDVDEVDAPRVVRTAPLTFMDTAMLLHLRQQLLTVSAGERAIVGQDEVQDHLAVYRPPGDADPAGYAKRVNASWEKLKRYGILAPTSTEGRFEVSPVLRLVFGPDQIAAVRTEYARLGGHEPVSPSTDSAGELAGTPVAEDDEGAA